MISSLGNFIAFVGAIYATLAIDNLMFKQFWTPDYYKMVKDQFNSIKNNSVSTIKNVFINDVKEKSIDLLKKSRMRGVIMFIVCITLLIFIGYENDINKHDLRYVYNAMLAFFIINVLIFAVLHFIILRWRYLFGLIFISFLPFGIFKLSNIRLFMLENEIFVDNLNIYLIFILIFPFAYQLFSHWIYSTGYKRYIHRQLYTEYELFNKARRAFEISNKKMLPKEYESISADMAVEKVTASDNQVTQLTTHFISRLKNACKIPGLFCIVKEALKREEKCKKEDDVFFKLQDEHDSVDKKFPTNSDSKRNPVNNGKYRNGTSHPHTLNSSGHKSRTNGQRKIK